MKFQPNESNRPAILSVSIRRSEKPITIKREQRTKETACLTRFKEPFTIVQPRIRRGSSPPLPNAGADFEIIPTPSTGIS